MYSTLYHVFLVIVIVILAMFIFYSSVQNYRINISESTMTMTGKTRYNAPPLVKKNLRNPNFWTIFSQVDHIMLCYCRGSRSSSGSEEVTKYVSYQLTSTNAWTSLDMEGKLDFDCYSLGGILLT